MILRPTAHHRRDLRGPLLTVVAALAGLAMLSYAVIMVLVVNADDTVAPYVPDPVAPYRADLGERPPLPAAPMRPAEPARPVEPARPDQPARPDRPPRPER
ncbi:MAG: hypothetical protein AB7R89_32300 [Dehalococcoidia bacterium]